MLVTGCHPASLTQYRQVVIQQDWELEPGDSIAGHLVAGSLGDISIQLNDRAVYAPFNGAIEPAANRVGCVYFSTPEIPAYLFRFCGLRQPYLGTVNATDVIGFSRVLHFATLRRQPDGTWAIVEPSSKVLERALQAPL